MPGIQPKSRVDPISVIHKIIDDVPINFKTQGVGVYLQPEWAAKLGIAKYVVAEEGDVGWAGTCRADYTVPAGKQLYINHMSGYNMAFVEANGGKNQLCMGWLVIAGVSFAVVGGNGGFTISLPTPALATAGQLVRAGIRNYAGHNTSVGISFYGYEINV